MSVPSHPARARWLASALMTLLCVLFVAPLLFVATASLKSDAQIFADLGSLRAFLPVGELSFDNYRAVLNKSALPRYLLNSCLVAVVTVALGVLVNSLAAFGLQRCRWRGQQWALSAVLALLVIPFELVAIPLMMMVAGLPWPGIEDGALILRKSWFSSLHVQIIPFIANAFCIFLFYQAFRDIPRALDEAAELDGAGPLRVYAHIIMPSSGPVISTAAIILFLTMWNQYLWPVLVVHGQANRPVMLGIQQFFGRNSAWGEIMAYATLITLPVLAVFILFQRRFVQSAVHAGIK